MAPQEGYLWIGGHIPSALLHCMYETLQINFDIAVLSTFKITPIFIISHFRDYWFNFLGEGKKKKKKLDHLSTSKTQFIIFYDLTIQPSSKQKGNVRRKKDCEMNFYINVWH